MKMPVGTQFLLTLAALFLLAVQVGTAAAAQVQPTPK
jgi:hypothetical protein